MTVQLSLVRPDFASIRSQLEDTLANYSAWRDLLPTGTGRTLTDWISAVGANDQYAIEHAFRESFRTARLESSIMAQAILLGVRLSRKLPCVCTVVLRKKSDGVLTLPSFTQFTGRNSLLYNSEAITLYDQDPVTVQLKEGSVIERNVVGDGTSYQMYVTEEDQYVISDEDVQVKLNDVTLERTTRGLWRLEGSPGYSDTTTATGQMLLIFGGESYGSVPETSDRIQITYVSTKGTLGQNAGLNGESIVCTSVREVTGIASSGLGGGGDEKSPAFYRKLGPQLFSARGGATSQDEYSAVGASYPGVIDAKILGQRHIAPADVRWMNMVQVSALTTAPWSGAEWDAFDEWFRARSIYPVRLYRKDPVPVTVDVTATVYCQGRADLNDVKAKVEAQLTKLFAPRAGLIDSNVYMHDLHAAIRGSESAVEYANIESPTTDIIVNVEAPANLTLSTAAGSLPAGQYHYAVTAVTALGETLATNFTSIVLDAAGGVTIVWDEVPQAVEFNIYGRTPLDLGRIGTVLASAPRSFTDDGSSPIITGLPLVDGAGHRYPKLGTLTIKTEYTNRNFYNLGSLK